MSNLENNNQNVERSTEASKIQDVTDKLQRAAAGGGGRMEALGRHELLSSVQTWEKQWDALPKGQNGKLDTANFTENDWKQVEQMYHDLNKPGGHLDRMNATVDYLKSELRIGVTNHEYHSKM